MSAVLDFPVKPEARPYLEAFGRDFGRHTCEPDWLSGQRRRSLARFAELGFPSRRSEAWRYLDLRALEASPMLPASAVPAVADASTRSLVSVGAGSRASIFETFAGQGSYWRNDVVELRLAAGAEFSRLGLVEESADALHLGETLAVLGSASRLASFMLLLGGRTVRHEATVRCEGEATHCAMNGAFVLSGRQEAN